MAEIHRLKVPESVAIVAMGTSHSSYTKLVANLGNRRRVADETWVINAMGSALEHDLLFHMDDCKVQESRAERDPKGNIASMVEWLRNHPRFFTSKVYEDYPGAIEFPLEQVINKLGISYFNNTVAYAVAYAMFLDVKTIKIFGADYTYANLHKAEKGRGCVEFLLGAAAARGIRIEVASDSTLLDANVPEDQRFYGYDACSVKLENTERGIIVHRTPRDALPSAEEIEKRYSHEPKSAEG